MCTAQCNVQGGPKRTAQSLWHHNFATVHHRVKWFSAKYSERNSLHDLSQCLNTAVKYSLFLQLAIELLKNNVPWPIKTCHYYFFQQLCETLANLNNFWHATLKRNLMQRSVVLATSPECCRYTTM